ncbi:MAG: hypothetical protein FD127_1422 [Acidimicrobiaceae bacterium]|nr:MAG: hypothetical protein FD127_1422 [Acidimicrobiaceae bacterium]
MRTSTAPQNPAIDGRQETHANADRYDGIARGSAKATRSTPRPGMSLRTTSQAAVAPTTTQAAVTVMLSARLRRTRSRVRCCQISSHTAAAPRDRARSTRYQIGAMATSAAASAGTRTNSGGARRIVERVSSLGPVPERADGRAMKPVTWAAQSVSKPTSDSSSWVASSESRSLRSISGGDSDSSDGNPAAVGTPSRNGNSNVSRAK